MKSLEEFLAENRYNDFKVEEGDVKKHFRKQRGHTELVRIDPRKLKRAWDSKNDDKLMNNEFRKTHVGGLKSINSYPEITCNSSGTPKIVDGRHRIGIAAERGQTIKVAVKPQHAKHVKDYFGV